MSNLNVINSIIILDIDYGNKKYPYCIKIFYVESSVKIGSYKECLPYCCYDANHPKKI